MDWRNTEHGRKLRVALYSIARQAAEAGICTEYIAKAMLDQALMSFQQDRTLPEAVAMLNCDVQAYNIYAAQTLAAVEAERNQHALEQRRRIADLETELERGRG